MTRLLKCPVTDIQKKRRVFLRVIDARKQVGLTMRAAASNAGISKSSWYGIENGEGIRNWSSDREKWERIAKTLDTTIEALLIDAPIEY